MGRPQQSAQHEVLVDMHAHVYPLASGIGLPADELVPHSATTTYVSAGDAGANNFGGFRHWVIAQVSVGAPADVSILELVEEPVTFVDTMNNQRKGSRWLRPVDTVRAGRPFGRPYPSPFSYPA